MELPESANKFSRLLVFSDSISKVVVLVPMQKASDVALAFVQHVLCWFGMPSSFFAIRARNSALQYSMKFASCWAHQSFIVLSILLIVMGTSNDRIGSSMIVSEPFNQIFLSWLGGTNMSSSFNLP